MQDPNLSAVYGRAFFRLKKEVETNAQLRNEQNRQTMAMLPRANPHLLNLQIGNRALEFDVSRHKL